mgnify:CR=1 FL=1
MIARRRITILCSVLAMIAMSGQACPPNANQTLPAPNPNPNPNQGSPIPPAEVAAGDGVLIEDSVVSLDTDFTDGLYWKLGGNNATDPAVDFIGTTDAQPFELRAGGNRALRLEPTDTVRPNIIGGSGLNAVSEGVFAGTIGGGAFVGVNNAPFPTDGQRVFDNYCTIGGGADNHAGSDDDVPTTATAATVAGGLTNRATADASTVSGGKNNRAEGVRATVGGGSNNTATGERATIGGGQSNTADRYATVGGGQVNNATGFSSTIGGGTSNDATGEYVTVAGGHGNEATGNLTAIGGGRDNRATALLAMVPGGFQCHATGFVSFAAGYNARAVHDGAFVWTDTAGIPVPFQSTADDQFLIRAAGGVGINTNAPQGALHTQASDDDTPDLVLGGTADDDNGLIMSDPALPSSDINFFSNGDVGFKLDSNNDETNGLFIIADGNEDPLFVVGENGRTGVIELNASEKVVAESFEAEDNLGAADTPDRGGVYRDNVVYAWADVQFNGAAISSFGCTVARQGATGLYRVTFKRQLPNGVSAIVTVKTLNDPVIATAVANQNFADVSTKVFNGAAFVPFDSAFYIQVVGRP